MNNKIASVKGDNLIKFIFFISLLIVSCHIKGQQYIFSTFPDEPWSYPHNDRVVGIIPDIANAIASKAGISITFKFVPYARMVKEMKLGNVDLAIFSRNPDNDHFVNYISPIFVQNIILLTRKGNKIKSIKYLYEQGNIRSIGVLRGSSLLSKLIKDRRIIQYPVKHSTEGLKMLNVKRFDALLIMDKVSQYESNKLILSDAFEFPGFPLKRLNVWLQVSKKSQYAESFPYQAVREATKQLASEGVFEKIINKYLGNTDLMESSISIGQSPTLKLEPVI